MQINLSEKTAVISGSTGGIGLDITKGLAQTQSSNAPPK